MPVHKVQGGYQWGNHGKVYKTKGKALAQARAIYSTGWRDDAKRAKLVRAGIKAWGASKRAEARYVLDLLSIVSGAHAGIMKVVEHEHLSPPDVHTDAKTPAGLGTGLLQRVVAWQKPRVIDAFDRMSKDVASKSQAAAVLHGIHVQHVAGVESAIDHSRAKNVSLITNATAEFLAQVRQVLEEREGEPADSIRKALQERVDVSKSRAILIARDQTLKLNSQIAQHRQRSAGVDSYRWSGSLDEREREIHRDLEGETISWDDPPETDEDGNTNHAGEDFQCFPGDSEIQLAHGVVTCFRRWYSGPLAEVVTSEDETIRATPNHPVLTRRGWVALGDLKLTDDVLQVAEEGFRPTEDDEHHRITRMSDLFASLQVNMVTHAPGAEADFHGDGVEGDVDVAFAARPLTFGCLAGLVESGDKLGLSDTKVTGSSLLRSTNELLVRFLGPSHGLVRGGRERQTIGSCGSIHPQQVGVRAPANLDASGDKARRQNGSVDASALCNGEQALSAFVGGDDGAHVDVEPVVGWLPLATIGPHADSSEFLAQIVGVDPERSGYLIQGLPAPQKFVRVCSVNINPFHGWVFNLETATGWYAAEGILAHNCRCVPIPIIDGLDDDDEESDEETGDTEDQPDEEDPDEE